MKATISSAPARSNRDTRLRYARSAIYLLSIVPVALPGLVLGLAYIFFFGDPKNPLHALYNTMALLVLSNDGPMLYTHIGLAM